MRRLLAALCLSLTAAVAAQGAEAAPVTETIVLIRHGEKPEQGLGQLSCRGLNRALKLPGVIAKDFGKPAAIFAPAPSDEIEDHGKSYAYVRPLATAEPTAIAFGLPVEARFGYDDIDKLEKALAEPVYRHATVLVVWEHKQLVKLVKSIVKDNGGDKNTVPKWPRDDFDSIYVLHVTRDGDRTNARFEQRSEGLNGQPDRCPA